MQERRPRDFGYGDAGVVESVLAPDDIWVAAVPRANLALGDILQLRIDGTRIQALNVYADTATLAWTFPPGDEPVSETGFIISIRRA